MKRRKALSTLGLSTLGMGLLAGYSRNSMAQDSTVVPEQSAGDGLIELLFVQEADAVTFADNSLTMIGPAPNTLFFADRPDDIAGFMSYQEYVEMVYKGPDNFNDDPPNATLIVFDDNNLSEAVFELSEKPVLKQDKMVFSSVKLIQGNPPAEGKTAVLFIDTIGRPLSPVSVAGVHRRHRRRRRRAIHN
jgi:hypothetical protein